MTSSERQGMETRPAGRGRRRTARLLACALGGAGLLSGVAMAATTPTLVPRTPALTTPALTTPALTARAPAARVVVVSTLRDEDAAREALKAASAAKRAAQKLEGAERDAALRDAATRYDALSADQGFPAAARAEAAFRAGEILRGLKEPEAAEARFATASELGADDADGRDFAARGVLERAHLRRRAGETEAALALYGEVRERYGDERRSAAHAATWTGKVLIGADRLAEARPVLLGFAEAYPEYPKEAVRNADLVAVELAEAGDEAGARAVVAELRARMAPVLEAGGKDAEGVQTALDAMKVTDLLGGD